MSRILVPGTVLLDIYQETGEAFLGGAEFNFAYHLHHLTGGVEFLARVGRDPVGRDILEELARRGFPTQGIQQDPLRPSKTVLVARGPDGEPVFRIPDGVASEHLECPPLSAQDLAAYDLVYFGTTLQHGARSRETLRRILAACGGEKFCDLNLRPGTFTRETVAYSLHACTCLKINRAELEVLTGLFKMSGPEDERLRRLSAAFSIPAVCLTLGAQGSVLYRRGLFYRRPAQAARVVDTVGAGDAFSAVLALGLLRGWEPGRTLDAAGEFAAAVCGQRGAVPSDPDFYRTFAPSP